MDHFILINHDNYYLYRKALDGMPGIEVLPYRESEKNNYQYIVLEVDSQKAGIDRDLMVKILHAENVLARRYFYPGCHMMEPYSSDDHRDTRFDLPETERLVNRVLTLPNGTSVGLEEIQAISEIIRLAISNSTQIVNRLVG